MTKPAWLKIAEADIGTTEIRGPQHSRLISKWLAKLHAWWSDDETPWCGTFVAHCLQECGMPIATHWYRAKGWADYGANLRAEYVAPGAILVFERKGGGHVGFYVGEDAQHYHVLGGNQGNMVSRMLLAKNRCIAIRWPKGEPVHGGPVKLAGGIVSRNEA